MYTLSSADALYSAIDREIADLARTGVWSPIRMSDVSTALQRTHAVRVLCLARQHARNARRVYKRLLVAPGNERLLAEFQTLHSLALHTFTSAMISVM